MRLFAPFGKLYGRIMELRNVFYDRGVLKRFELGARTISVGNLTTGGTGKTPLVALIAKLLIDEGETVCILTRGYWRKDPKSRVLVSDGTNILADAETGGDEPVELAHKLNGKAVIVADPDRVAAAKWARDRYQITTLILDDGFQHRRARRDLDIVCIDATNPCGNGRVLPAGTLRESFDGLKRAGAIVVTRTEQVAYTHELEKRLRGRNASAPIFKAESKIGGLVLIEELHTNPQRTQPTSPGKLSAFTGIGNPKNFYTSLRSDGYDLVATESFPDHHRFTQSDIAQVEETARTSGATALVTTAKDAVKLSNLHFTLPCYVALAETVIDDFDTFKGLITSS